MKITKTAAEEAAKLMAEKAFENEMKSLHLIIREAYELVIRAHITAKVISAVNEYPELLCGTISVYFYWNGQYFYEDISFFTPSSRKSLSNLLSEEEKKEIQEKLRKLVMLKTKQQDFEYKCVFSLFCLKTRKRIEVIFPEAMKYILWLAEPTKNLPAAQLEELRFALQKCRKD